MTKTEQRAVATAVVTIAKEAAGYDAITELWSTEDERFEYARNCVSDAMTYDKLTPEFITANAKQVIQSDIAANS